MAVLFFIRLIYPSENPSRSRLTGFAVIAIRDQIKGATVGTKRVALSVSYFFLLLLFPFALFRLPRDRGLLLASAFSLFTFAAV